MRDLIAHHYFSVEPQIVWEAATRHVPKILEHARRPRERFEETGRELSEKGNVLGFSIMRVSALRDAPLEVAR